MSIFFSTLIFLFMLMGWQLLRYLSVPRGHFLRKRILPRIAVLLLVIGLVVYAYQSALEKETQFLTLLPTYPQARFDMWKTPILSSSAYWAYTADATPDQVFNWYRSRSKHAGWTIVDEDNPDARVFVIVLPPRINVFVILKEEKGKTSITYTTEGSMMRSVAAE